MTRREALTRLALLMGSTLIVGDAFLSGVPLRAAGTAAPTFSADDIALMDEIGETIIPTTNTPGAKATGIGQFMVLMVKDCYYPDHQALFQSGLKKVDEASRAKFGKSFREATPAQRTELLTALDAEQKQAQRTRAAGDLPHYFRLMKELTLVGYFTSEIGQTQAMRYVEVPGKFDGNVPYKKGDRAWATMASRGLQ
jgi:hypothetical protein